MIVRNVASVAFALQLSGLGVQREQHLPVEVAVVEVNLDVESVTIGRCHRPGRFQIHRLQRELQMGAHQRGEVDVDVHPLQQVVRRIVSVKGLETDVHARLHDLVVEYVALVEAEYDAFLVLIEAQSHGPDRIVFGDVGIRADGVVDVVVTMQSVINSIIEIAAFVDSQWSCRGWVRRYLREKKIASQCKYPRVFSN